MNYTSNLEGKKIIFLGGTSGIGLETAKAAVKEGASVIVASSRKNSVDRALSQLPKGSEGYALDLTNEEEIKKFFKEIGRFDHLMFTAGESLLIEEISSTEINNARERFNLRYWGAYMSIKYGYENINKGGSIVLTTGIAGDRPETKWTIAASICGAMTSLTKALAIELAPIRVNAVSPGIVKTELWKNMSNEDRDTMYKTVGQSLPVERVGEASDLAEAYLFLMRENFITGQIITVDGGATLV